jgi:hypothetical protein
MVISGGQAVFAVVAKDAATKTLNGVGKAFGGLKRNGIAALRGIATASVAAAGALIGFTVKAIQAAADEEMQIIRLNAALKARGFAMDQLTPKIDAQIESMKRLGFADDEVRTSLEIGSRFFKNQEKLLAANSAAANISAATGKPLAEVMMAIGKGAKGSTRGLLGLGIEVKKGAKLQDILRIANEKYAGVAEEVANSTGGRFKTAQLELNDAFEDFGAKFLPVVNDALTTFTQDVLPKVEQFLDDLGPIIQDLADNYIGPLVDSFDDLAKSMGFEDGFGFLIGAIEVALIPLKVALGVLKGLLDGINEAFKLFNSLSSSKTGALIAGNARTQYLTGGNLGVSTPTSEMSGYLQTNVQLSIGTQKQDQLVSGALQRMAPGRRGGY